MAPGLGQVLVEQKGTFQCTIPCNHGQPSSSEAMLPEPLRHQFQWSDDEEEASGYASSATINSVQARFVSATMADSNNDDLRHRMEAQEQTSKAQQKILDNIQQILAQLLTNRNNDNTTGSNHENEENNNDEPPKSDHSKEGSSIDAEVIKGIQAQIVSLAQRDELKKVGAIHHYPSKWIQSHIRQSSRHQR